MKKKGDSPKPKFTANPKYEGYFGYVDELSDEALKCFAKAMGEIIKTLAQEKDPEATIFFLHEFKSRFDHINGIGFRRTIEALMSAVAIKQLLDEGFTKEQAYTTIVGAIAKTMDAEEFSMVINDLDEVLKAYYGIDDFLPTIEAFAKRVKGQMERDVF